MKRFKKFIILLLIWVTVVLSANSLPTLSIPWIVLAIIFLPLSIVLFFLALGILINFYAWVVSEILSIFVPRKENAHQGKEKNHPQDSFTEQVTLDHPDYVGILTKIDKKKIAEEYLAEQKRKNK